MAHIYKATMWKDSCFEEWSCGDTSWTDDKGSKCGCWWVPCRILQMSPVEYLKIMIKEYHIVIKQYHKYEDGYQLIRWVFTTEQDARNYKNFINKKARERKFLC